MTIDTIKATSLHIKYISINYFQLTFSHRSVKVYAAWCSNSKSPASWVNLEKPSCVSDLTLLANKTEGCDEVRLPAGKSNCMADIRDVRYYDNEHFCLLAKSEKESHEFFIKVSFKVSAF